ncbi:hypothetical protein K2X85_06465 [bacterium]|nr:hypothetical protein [bacterium]
MSSDTLPSASVSGSPGNGWNRFWFQQILPGRFHWVRFFTGLLLTCWLLSFAFSYQEAVGRDGWLDGKAEEAIRRLPESGEIPKSWARDLVPSSPALLGTLYLATIVNAVFLTLGWATRLTAPLAWLSVQIFTSNPILYDGSNALLAVLVLYVAVGCVGMHFRLFDLGFAPLPWRALVLERPSVFANIALRLIQVHFAIIIVMSLLHKFQDAEWWAGDALWYSLYTPFETNVGNLLQQAGRRDNWLVLISLATYLTMIWQATFPIQPFTRLGRWVMFLGGVIGWIWCDLIARQPVFGPAIMIAIVASCRSVDKSSSR